MCNNLRGCSKLRFIIVWADNLLYMKLEGYYMTFFNNCTIMYFFRKHNRPNVNDDD
jgi:hypothetical protein